MKMFNFIDVDGFRLPPTFDPETFRVSRKYKPKQGQIVVATFPKCGTTWTLQIVTLILRKGLPSADAGEYFSLMPFMEMMPLHLLENLPEGGCLKTHLPFEKINFSEDAKYIYVARNPADCAVSFYHHVRYFPVYFFSDGTFDDFFEIFITGKTDFGDYFDSLLSWYEHRNEPNLLFVTYEALKADPRGMVLKIAKFLGEEYYENLMSNNEEILKKVLEYSSVEYMKSTVDRFWEEIFLQVPPEEVQKMTPVMKNYADIYQAASRAGHHSVGNFVRKGMVGDGKIALSEDQKKRLENRIKEKCSHSDVMDLWKSQ